MEEEKIIKVKKLSYQELIKVEDKLKIFLKNVEADYKETKAKGGQ